MKSFFVLFLAASVSVCAASGIEKFSDARLASANAEYASALADSQKAVDAARARYLSVCAQIDSAKAKIARLERAKDAAANMAAKRDFYGSVVSELSAECQRAFDGGAAAVSAAEVSAAIKSQLRASLDALKKPLEPVQCEAVRAKTRARISGASFRVGGFRYFVGGGTAGFLADGNVLYGEKYARQIIDFSEGKTAEIPADISFGGLLKSERSSLTVAEQIEKGGVWIFPILFLGALSLLVAAVKFVWLYAVGGRGMPAFGASAEPLKFPYKDIAAQIDAADSPDSAAAAASSALARANSALKSHLGVLATTAAVAPLLGLLGTVSGIIKTFSDLSAAAAQSRDISDGIAEALITTEYGLIVAIPALIAGAVLSRKARGIAAFAREFAEGRLALKK